MIHKFFDQFPNLHPLLVHFPIALLLFAVLTQFSVLFFPKSQSLKWFTFALLLSGCIGAFAAVQTAVHISGDADDKAFDIFETHRQLGQLTQWFSLAASLIRLVTIKWFHKMWLEFILSLLILSTGIVVTIAGHHGAQLVYIYNVGPQGENVMSK
jgi:uncharacterized membrane protein